MLWLIRRRDFLAIWSWSISQLLTWSLKLFYAIEFLQAISAAMLKVVNFAVYPPFCMFGLPGNFYFFFWQ
jgi:hypothetical protein